MNTTPPKIFLFNAVVGLLGESKVLHESGGIFEASIPLSESKDYMELSNGLIELVIKSFTCEGGNFDPQKHRVIIRSLSRLQ